MSSPEAQDEIVAARLLTLVTWQIKLTLSGVAGCALLNMLAQGAIVTRRAGPTGGRADHVAKREGITHVMWGLSARARLEIL
jgi:hypothetical protein